MVRPSKSERTWSESELREAVAASANWRDVMRTLGLNAGSAGTIRIVRRHADNLGLDTSHFRRKRAWSDAQLRSAVADAQSWDELLTALGLAPRSGNGKVRVKAHAMRMGLDLAHVEKPGAEAPGLGEVIPNLRYLRDAATTIAASWFSLCGLSVALPVEPALYDLLVTMPDGVKRVQVKTTTHYSKDGWTVVVGRRPYSAGNRERLLPYDPELIDWFFIVDGELAMYLIPSNVIAGRVGILLRTYTRYIVGNSAGLMTSRAA
jgi:hypothetical protein